MSKSLGNVVKPGPLIDDFGADGLRYFLLREMTFGMDGSYSDEQLLDRYNGDLANDLGNLTSRIVTLIHGGCDGVVPPPSDEPHERELAPLAERAFADYRAAFDDYNFSNGLSAVWSLAAGVNRFLVEHAPWELVKDPAQRPRHHAVLRGAAEALLQVAAMAAPVMPEACAEVAKRLGATLPDSLAEFRWGLLPERAEVVKKGPLFPRIDKRTYFEESKSMEEKKTPPQAEADDRMTIDQFMKVDLRVARVLTAARVEGTDKLLKLEIDIGSEKRQIVAGIAQQYEPEALVGKTIVMVANLKPAKVRGVESQGMLLAADAGEGPVVATFETDVTPGTRVR
jgi:methionyl-tRNA synthetase